MSKYEKQKKMMHQVADFASGVMLEYFDAQVASTRKQDDSVVTEADIKINDHVVCIVKKEFPNDGILAEEGGGVDSKNGYMWICDPIDGTFPFSRGVGASVFTISLMLEGQPILALVRDPFLDRTYFAEKDCGAFMNQKKIRVSSSSLNQETVFIGWWQGQETYNAIGIMNDLLQTHNCASTTLMSVLQEGVSVARGSFPGMVFPVHTPWDMAATKLIVEEAGGKVTNLLGEEQRYDQECFGQIATNGIVHDQVLEIVKKHLIN